jgi:DNA-binding transcriptional MerR regulator
MTTTAPMGPREVAEASGVSPDTIRHYERRGLIPRAARTQAGYRRYPPDTVARVAMVRRALAMGFSVKDLAAIFRDRDRGAAPCRRVRGILAGRLSRIDDEIASLVRLKSEMAALLEEWDARLAVTPSSSQARLLDCLTKPRT